MGQPITSERWRQVKQIFQSAVEIPTAGRVIYLTDACAGDPALLAEVETLIAAHEQSGSFLDAPAFNLAAEPPAHSLVGRSVGRYQILELLGRGGMGEIYKAKDSMLGRDVAIKVLSPTVSFDQDRLRRFEQEARAASALNHPNIITIHEFGEEGGIHFIASEFIEGQTLRRVMSERMSSGAMLNIAIQIVDALGAAHKAGIVHRDIKPENIMVRPDGLVKVLDFGLAKLVERPVGPHANLTEASTIDWGRTETGVVMGTVSYMSPEQTRGQKLDARTDIFSLGVVLYEMIAGLSPFAHATPADVIASILEKEPPPLAHFTAEAPEGMEAIVRKTLRKNREERYQTAGELQTDLKRLKSGASVAALIPANHDHVIGAFGRHCRIAALTLAALFAVIAGSHHFSERNKAIESIAVLPFINAGGDPETEYLADGITESVINGMTQLPNMIVRPRNSVFRYQRGDIDPQAAGRKLDVEAVLTGQVAPRGDEIIISLQLIDVRGNRQLWGARYQRRFADLLTLQAEISQEVSDNLRQQFRRSDQQPTAKRNTDNIEAYRAYLRGRHFWNKRSREGFEKAIKYYDEAIAIDPNYALAHAGLADCRLSMAAYGLSPSGEGFLKAKEAAKKALTIDGALAEAHTSLAHIAWLHEWKWVEAEKGFKRAIELNPDYATAHHWYAVYLSVMARHDEALAEIKRAQALDPLSSIIDFAAARIYYFARQYDQAIEQSLKVIEMDPGYRVDPIWLRLAYEQRGLDDKAFEVALKILKNRGAPPGDVAEFKETYAASGWRGVWLKRRELVEKGAVNKPVSPYFIAVIYVRLGDHDKSLEWLRKAYDRHSEHLVTLKVDPLLDPLRSDPRFQDLQRRMGLAP
jgi:serine/threonine protein kinase/tetratricopeptide (TPR) repeat protein